MDKAMIELDKIYNEDCLVGMKRLLDKSIDLIVTDPPYKVTQKGCAGTMGGYWTYKSANEGKIFSYNDTDIEQYIHEFYRILKDDAHCYIMCNNLNLPHFFDIISKSQFHFVKLLIWDKQSKICGRYYMGRVEFIFFLRKGRDKPINDCSICDLLSFSNFNRPKDAKGKNLHNSIKPIPLMQCLIENSSFENEIVLDPFIGSGTTSIACIKEKRHFIGFEIDKKYYDIANERINNETRQLTIF